MHFEVHTRLWDDQTFIDIGFKDVRSTSKFILRHELIVYIRIKAKHTYFTLNQNFQLDLSKLI